MAVPDPGNTPAMDDWRGLEPCIFRKHACRLSRPIEEIEIEAILGTVRASGQWPPKVRAVPVILPDDGVAIYTRVALRARRHGDSELSICRKIEGVDVVMGVVFLRLITLVRPNDPVIVDGKMYAMRGLRSDTLLLPGQPIQHKDVVERLGIIHPIIADGGLFYLSDPGKVLP